MMIFPTSTGTPVVPEIGILSGTQKRRHSMERLTVLRGKASVMQNVSQNESWFLRVPQMRVLICIMTSHASFQNTSAIKREAVLRCVTH
jgi:hypothetical protein